MPRATATAVPAPATLDNYPILSPEMLDISEIITENLGGNIGPSDLGRVKVPAGGSTTWILPDADADGGERESKEVVGIVIYNRTTRSYWPGEYDGSRNPPACSSVDGQTGIGNPGGACARCQFAEFGSKTDSNGQACKTAQEIFIVIEGQILPLVLSVPPSSLKAFRAYATRQLSAGRKLSEMLTKITLEKTKNSGGIVYAEMHFSSVQQLVAGDKAAVARYAAGIRGPLAALAALPEASSNGNGGTPHTPAFDSGSDDDFDRLGA
jgi:hypothetical protein